jgi:CubicO group peptidase (beta-lactamase class C family)
MTKRSAYQIMKRMLLLVLTFTLIFSIQPIQAQQEDPSIPYEDPQGFFTTVIPSTWTLTQEDEYGVATSPEGNLTVYLLSVEATDLQQGIADAWSTIDPDFNREAVQEQPLPATGGIEAAAQNVYSVEPDDVVIGIGQLYAGRVYAVLIKGTLEELQRRNAQVQVIFTGITITGLDRTDLSEVEPLAVDETLIADLEAFIEKYMEEFGIPGTAVAIVQNDQVVYLKGFGVRQAGRDEPITPQTRMMIGSTGKTMTTMFMATLVDEGLVQWDTPVVDILPEFAVKDEDITQQITFRNLVCACTGVPRRDAEFLLNANELSAEDVIESLRTFEFFTGFGETFQYSNQLVATGGYVAAAVDGGEYGSLFDAYVQSMQEHVFGPVGMVNTTFDFAEVTASGDYAIPHGVNLLLDDYIPIDLSIEQTLTPIAPAGASWSTAEDMANYLITELNIGVAPDGTRVVSEENLRETWQPQVQLSADTSYGLGWFVGTYKGQPLLSHGGNTLGFTSDLAFLPEADLGIVVLTNGQASNLFNEGVRQRLFELVFEQPSEIAGVLDSTIAQAEGTLAEIRAGVGEALTEDEAQPFLGTYSHPVLGEVDIRYEGGKLTADVGEFALELRPNVSEEAEPNTFVTLETPLAGERVQFTNEGTMIFGTGVTEYTFTRK